MEMTVAKYPVSLRTKSACLLALAVLVLSGCGSATTDGAVGSSGKAKAAAPGSTVSTDNVNGYSVTMPAGYTRIKDKAALQAMVKRNASKNPKLGSALAEYAPLFAKASFFAIRLKDKGFNNSFNIIPTPSPGAKASDMAGLYDTMKLTLEAKLNAKIIDHKIIDVSGTEALRIDYRLKSGTQNVLGTQIYVVHKDNVLIMSVTRKDAPTSVADTNMIIDGLRLN